MLTDKVEGKIASTAWRPVMMYLALAYGIAWVLWLPLVLGPSGLRVTRYDAYLPFFGSLGTVGPLIASFLAVRYETGRWAMPSRFFPTKRWSSWLNLLTGPVLTILAFVVIPYMICIAPGHKLIALGFLTPLSAVWPNMLGGPLEEEFGWRGYLLPRLAGRMGNTWSTLVVGVIWASWHLPLFLYRGWTGVSFWYFLPEITALGGVRVARILRDGAQYSWTHPGALRLQYVPDHAGQGFLSPAALRQPRRERDHFGLYGGGCPADDCGHTRAVGRARRRPVMMGGGGNELRGLSGEGFDPIGCVLCAAKRAH